MNTEVFSFNNAKIAIVKVDDWKRNFPQKKYSNEKASFKRIIERDCIQFLLSQFLPKYKLSYNSNGKPTLNNGGFISISHSKSLVGIAWSFTYNIGLDIEEINDRIIKVQDRFINHEEILFADSLKDKINIWSIKEALIKICDNKTLNLRTDLKVKKIENDKWFGYASHLPAEQFEFSTFEFCNNIICINTTGGK